MAIPQRMKAFHSCGDLKKHFERKHLRHLPDGQPSIVHTRSVTRDYWTSNTSEIMRQMFTGRSTRCR